MSELDDFFTPPWPVAATEAGRHSVLHLLRCEVQDCLVGEPMAEDELITFLADPRNHHRLHRLFAATMVMLAGIDLLGKFYSGDDQLRGATRRFKEFVNACVYAPGDGAADALWGVRNALMHSFSLYDIGAKAEILLTTDLPTEAPSVGVKVRANVWQVSIPVLYRDFVHGIRKYQAQLHSQSEEGNKRREKFAKMYPDYGSIAGSW